MITINYYKLTLRNIRLYSLALHKITMFICRPYLCSENNALNLSDADSWKRARMQSSFLWVWHSINKF